MNSIVLVILAAVISIPLSIAIGSYAALHREKGFDTVVSNVMLALASLPEFVVALLLVILFSTSVFHWLPAISPGATRTPSVGVPRRADPARG